MRNRLCFFGDFAIFHIYFCVSFLFKIRFESHWVPSGRLCVVSFVSFLFSRVVCVKFLNFHFWNFEICHFGGWGWVSVDSDSFPLWTSTPCLCAIVFAFFLYRKGPSTRFITEIGIMGTLCGRCFFPKAILPAHYFLFWPFPSEHLNDFKFSFIPSRWGCSYFCKWFDSPFLVQIYYVDF